MSYIPISQIILKHINITFVYLWGKVIRIESSKSGTDISMYYPLKPPNASLTLYKYSMR
jgi:hypothetical protein